MVGASRRKARLPRKILRIQQSDGKWELQPQENGGKSDDGSEDYFGYSPKQDDNHRMKTHTISRHSPLNGFYEKYGNGNALDSYAGVYLTEATKLFMKSQDKYDYVVVQPCYDLPPPPTLLSDTGNKLPSPKEEKPQKLNGSVERKRDIPNVTRKHHHPEPTPDYPYQCETCDMLFKTIELLSDHQKTLHDNNRQFACRYCSKRFNDKYNMRKHVLIHVGEKRHKCQFCDKAFLRKDHLRSHLQTHYNRKYGCKICGKSFRTIELYQRHAKTHKDLTSMSLENLQPTLSEERITTPKQEEITENGRQKSPYDPPLNDSSLNDSGLWNRTDSPALSDLDRSVNNSPSHVEHGNPRNSNGDHVGKGYKCGFCNVKFEDQTSLIDHEHTCKSNNPKWQCKKCNIVFDESITLKQHYDKVHSTEKTVQSPSRWRCKTCNINYPNSKELSRHYAHAHKDAQIFPCSECPKTFTVWHNLKKHMLIHLGDKKHKCNVCDKGFVRKDHLNSHMKVHLGDGSKFTCPICSKVFRLKQMYYKHMNLHGLEQAFTQQI